jgi:hypothetical protein
MKRQTFKLVVIVGIFSLVILLGYALNRVSIKRRAFLDQHVVVSCAQFIDSQSAHRQYNHAMHEIIDDINSMLQARGYISDQASKLYSHKKNEVFITHFDHHFGHCTLHIPHALSYHRFIELAQPIFQEQGLVVRFSKEMHIELASPIAGFEGQAFDVETLEKYRKMKKADFTAPDLSEDQQKEYKEIEPMWEYFDWQWKDPMVGLIKDDSQLSNLVPDSGAPYSWQYSLWDFAPHQGKGIVVADIDTGVSSFPVQGQEQVYKKHCNITMPNVLNQYGYNLVAHDGIDPIGDFAVQIRDLFDPQAISYDTIIQDAPNWILDYLQNKKYDNLSNLFSKDAKLDFKQQNGQINELGKQALQDFLKSHLEDPHFSKDALFHIADLQGVYHEKVLQECVPAPKITDDEQTFTAGHGTFTYSLVGGQKYQGQGITGLAPQATVLMIKAFDDDGSTSKSTLNAALKRSLVLHSDVINMSLKISDTIDPQSQEIVHLQQLIDGHDYVIAASGNDGTTAGLGEAWPAQFPSVAFDVGSYQWNTDKQTFTVSPFTQYQKNVGPKFLAPGYNILSAGLVPGQTDDSMYVFMSGTSVATPMITGFMTLMLGEVKHVLTKPEILKIVYGSAFCLGSGSDWKNKTLLGAIDMRSALCIAQVVKQIVQKITPQQRAQYFDQIVQMAYDVLFEKPNACAAKVGLSLQDDIMQYAQKIKTVSIGQQFPSFSSADQVITYIAQKVLQSFTQFVAAQQAQEKALAGQKEQDESIKPIIFNQGRTLFQGVDPIVKNRLDTAINHTHEKENPTWWDTQMSSIKQGAKT